MLHAVVVGINDYNDEYVPDLSFARDDAIAVAGLLGRVRPDESNIRLMLDDEATRESIMTDIGEDLPRVVEPDDVVVVYFAGHGSPETDGSPDHASRYLVAYDTRYAKVFSTGIDMERDLQRLFERLTSPRLVLVAIDACFSGLAGGRTFEGPALRKARVTSRDISPISLIDLDLGEGRLMIGACGDAELAREEYALGHGVFTHYLLQGPASLSAGDRPAAVSLHALYDAVATKVRHHTSGRQTPVINGRSSFAHIPNLW